MIVEKVVVSCIGSVRKAIQMKHVPTPAQMSSMCGFILTQIFLAINMSYQQAMTATL